MDNHVRDGKDLVGHQVPLSANAQKDLCAKSVTSAPPLEDFYFNVKPLQSVLTLG